MRKGEKGLQGGGWKEEGKRRRQNAKGELLITEHHSQSSVLHRHERTLSMLNEVGGKLGRLYEPLTPSSSSKPQPRGELAGSNLP